MSSIQEARADERKPAKYNGQRGEPFRTFKREAMVYARGRFAKDDQFSYHSAYIGMDQGGVRPPRSKERPTISTVVVENVS